MDDMLTFSVAALQQGYREKAFSPVEVMRAVLGQVERVNPALNAFAFLPDEKESLAVAVESEKRFMRGAPLGALDGVPVTVKDWYDVRGWPTRYGSLTSSAAPKEQDSPLVKHLRGAGALILGKTTLPEFGHTGTTSSPLTGITRNPWNHGMTAGGSSGGAGVAAATGMGFLHVGSDAGGSIRIPASFCGVFGFKPSPGLVPNWPPSPFSTLSAAGPLARRVADVALMLDVMAQPDADDWNQLPLPPPRFAAGLERPARKLRIAYAPTLNKAPVEPEVAALTRKAAGKMEAFGAVEEITLDIPGSTEVFITHWLAMAAWMTRLYPPEARAQMDPGLIEWAEEGAALPRDEYLQAEVDRMKIGGQMKKLLEDYDILVMPTLAMTAFDASRTFPADNSGSPWEDWTPFTFPANLARLPAASIPCGVTKSGLPVGLQVMGGYLQDQKVLQACAALEEVLGFEDWLKKSPLPLGGEGQGEGVRRSRNL